MGRGKSGRGVEALAKCIRIKFFINGEQFRETINLAPTPPNIRYAERLKREIDAKIEHGVFDYATTFPNSPNLVRLGISTSKPTFKHYAELWYKTTERLAKGTRIQYRRYLDAVWLPKYGEKAITEILPSEVEVEVASRDWGSVKNMNNHLTALRGPFNLAVKDRIISLDRNPAAGVENRKYEAPGADPFMLAEIDVILADMFKHYPEPIGNYFETAFFSGMRPEEQIAVQWPDMDWGHEMLRIDKAMSYGELKGTKTGVSRDLELSCRAIEALRRQKKFTFLQGGVIFISPVTKRPFPSSQQLRDTYWKSSLKRVGIRSRDMYQTRHTFATLNIMARANPAWVARQLGHSVQMLFKVYFKWIQGADNGSERAKLDEKLKQQGDANGHRNNKTDS